MSMFRQPVVGVRKDPPTNVKGRFTPGSTTPINFTASIQPATGDELDALPEGLRENGMYRLYTDFALRTVNESTKKPADVIDYNSKKYKIVQVEPWQNNVISHYKAFMSEIDDA